MKYLQTDRTYAAVGMAVWVFFAGCTSEPPLSNQSEPRTGRADGTPVPATESAVPTAIVNDLDQWDAYYLQGNRIGYGHLRIRLVDGQRIVSSLNVIHVQRFGEQTKQEMRLDATETASGHLISFRLTTSLGTENVTTEGRVEGDELLLTTRTRGRVSESRLPWVPGTGGFFAVEDSLLANPMKPGESRTVRAMIAGFDAVAEVRLRAVKTETVDVLTSTQELLRIEKTILLPGSPPVEETVWADSSGRVLKSRVAMLEMESYLVPKEEALRDHDAAEFDLGMDISVPLDARIPNPRDATQLAYRVTLEDKNPAEAFPSGPFQTVKEVDSRTAVVEVRSARGGPGAGEANTEEVAPEYLKPSAYVQSDDPGIRRLASQATEEAADSWEKAKALEAFAHEYITRTDFSQAFSSAAEVLETKQGDCTEHAVFLAALSRAAGIPSRLAVGLVYMEGAGAFGYHMWTEVFVGGRWIPVDATLGLGGAGATHLKLGDTALEGGVPFGQFLPLLETAGKLRIQLEK